MPTSVQNTTVTPDESGMRVDRFLEQRFPGLSFSHIQRVIRKGEVRVNGKRTQPKNRLETGQTIRIPPPRLDAPKPGAPGNAADDKTREFLKSITLYEDADVLVLNKPMGLAVQGGSGTTRHLDGMLEVLRDAHGQRPRLVHRLDKDTAGCLLVAKTRFAASALAKTFRSRSARKVYWALVAGVPKVPQGRISTFLAKEERDDESFMRIAQHGDKGASHAVTYYPVVDTSGRVKPVKVLSGATDLRVAATEALKPRREIADRPAGREAEGHGMRFRPVRNGQIRADFADRELQIAAPFVLVSVLGLRPSTVMAGLAQARPGHPDREAQCPPNRDRRDKPGDDISA